MKDNVFLEVKKEILDEIKKNKKIIIHRHIRPDPDALGSQSGLSELIKLNYPDKKVFTAGEDVDTLDFMTKMNPPTKEDYEEALIIVTDTADTPRIDQEFPFVNKNKIIKIDHHPNEEPYGDIQWVDTNASSTSEMITDLWDTFSDELSLSDEGARLLYAGIVGDTNRFLYDATTPKTMRLAAQLMERSFSHTDLNYKMNELNPKVAKLVGYVLENLNISKNGVASIVLNDKILDKFDLKDKDTHQVVSIPGTIEGVLSWGIFVYQEDGTYRCRLRSKGPIINEIAKEHDGGGHPLASGANAKDLEEVEEILEKFEEAVIKYKKSKQ